MLSSVLHIAYCRAPQGLCWYVFSMFWKSVMPIFLAKTQGFMHFSQDGFLWMPLLPSKVRKKWVFPLKDNWQYYLFLKMILLLQIFAHNASSNDGLCIYHLLSSTIFHFFFKGCLAIFVFLCLNPKQILMMISLYT